MTRKEQPDIATQSASGQSLNSRPASERREEARAPHLRVAVEASRSFLNGVTRRFGTLPLRWRIGSFVLVGLVAMLVLFGVLGYAIAQDGRRRIISERAAIASSTASFLDSELDEQYQRLEGAASRLGQATSAASRREVLKNLLDQPEPFISSAFLLDGNGDVQMAEPAGRTDLLTYVVEHPAASRPLATGARYASGVHPLPDGSPTAIFSVPVFGLGHATVGVLGVALDPRRGVLKELVSDARGLARTGHAELVDQNEFVVVSSEPNRILKAGEHPDFYRPLLAQRQSGVGVTQPVGEADPSDTGQRHVMAFVPLKSVPWGLSVGGTEGELSADADRWQWQITLLGSLSLLVALFLVWVTTRSVARPVQALTAASRRIASGDLSTPVPRQGGGEIRELAEAFDDMRGDLLEALSELAIEKSRYEGIVGSMADAVVTTNLDLRITAFNPAAVALTGWPAEQALGKRYCEVLCGTGQQPSEGCSSSCGLTPEQVLNADQGAIKEAIGTRDGRTITVATTRSAIQDQAGHAAAIVHVLRDISAEEEVTRLKDEFLSTVSHELRTPLGFVKGYATTLLLPDGLQDEKLTKQCLRVIVDASDELEELVDNLLDMSKIGAGVLSVAPVSLPLSRLARAAVKRVRIRAKGHHLKIAVPASLPRVAADARRIEQVLYNLLDNAVKYSPDGGSITIQGTEVGGEVIVGVVDQGLGIPADELDVLFERFHRGKNARAHQIGGSGLGLAICKGIVEAHGGRIWAISPAPGEHDQPCGTVINFTLPVAGCAVLPQAEVA